jgi:hypothetical protein
VAIRSSGLRTAVLVLVVGGSALAGLDPASATQPRGMRAAATNQSAAIRRSILDAITKNDPVVCTDLFTDHGIVDDVNALYVRGFNGPMTQDPSQARSTCEQVHSTNATPARSLVKVKKLRVTKNKTAKASVEVGVGGTYQVGLVRDGRIWKIDSVS